MSEHQAVNVAAADKYHFLIRRLHSLTGLVPVGVFLFLHLLTNAAILAPGAQGDEYQKAIERIHALGPLLVPVEIVGIFLPLAFHTLIGFQIIFSSRSNAQQYRYGSNIRYMLQRQTGIIAFFFILYHVWQMHWLGAPLGGGQFELHDASGAAAAARTTAESLKSAWWVAPVYVIGILASVFHLANGVWTSLITWGITIRPRSQQVAGYFCTVFGVVLALVGLGAIQGFKNFGTADSGPEAKAQMSTTVSHTP